MRGSLVVVDRLLADSLQRLAEAGARAVIVLDPYGSELTTEAGLYLVPIVRLSPTALAMGHALPNPRSAADGLVSINASSHLHIVVDTATRPTMAVIGRQPGKGGQLPVAIVAARFDPAELDTFNATAPALLITILRYVEEHPIAADVVAVATSGDERSFAALRLGLAQLDADERARTRLVMVIGPTLSGEVVIETQSDAISSSGTGRLAARVAEALGAQVSEGDDRLLRAVSSSALPPAVITESAPGSDMQPSAEHLRRLAEAVLVSLAYVPRHLEELR